MAKANNIVHQYFKKQFDGYRILVKVNPIYLKGMEIVLSPNSLPQLRELDFDAAIIEDLKKDDFEECNALEFNLYLSGLAK
jgi:hypothetical protein